MLLIRVVNPLMGLPGMLSAIIACETDSTGNSAKPSEAGVLSQEGGGVLPNDVQPAASDEVWNSKNTTRPSKFNMVTGQQGRSKAAAELATSPNDSEVRLIRKVPWLEPDVNASVLLLHKLHALLPTSCNHMSAAAG